MGRAAFGPNTVPGGKTSGIILLIKRAGRIIPGTHYNGSDMLKNMRNRQRKGKPSKFRPSHEFIAEETEYFKANGGKITKLEFNKNEFEVFVASSEPGRSVDEFLNGY